MWLNRKVMTSCCYCGPMATGHQCNISSQNTVPPAQSQTWHSVNKDQLWRNNRVNYLSSIAAW